MDIQIAFSIFLSIFLLKCFMVSAQFDFNPAVIDETQKPVDSKEIKCLGTYMMDTVSHAHLLFLFSKMFILQITLY